MSLIDVIVPCYNYGRYLRGCVESVLSHERVWTSRVLIIDDASPGPHSCQVGKKMGGQGQPAVEYRRHAANWGTHRDLQRRGWNGPVTITPFCSRQTTSSLLGRCTERPG